jgi:hypothetical protein
MSRCVFDPFVDDPHPTTSATVPITGSQKHRRFNRASTGESIVTGRTEHILNET